MEQYFHYERITTKFRNFGVMILKLNSVKDGINIMKAETSRQGKLLAMMHVTVRVAENLLSWKTGYFNIHS